MRWILILALVVGGCLGEGETNAEVAAPTEEEAMSLAEGEAMDSHCTGGSFEIDKNDNISH